MAVSASAYPNVLHAHSIADARSQAWRLHAVNALPTDLLVDVLERIQRLCLLVLDHPDLERQGEAM